MILAGDIGGTKTNLAYFSTDNGAPKPVLERTFSSQAYNSLNEILNEFAKECQGKCQSAVLSIAGPIKNNVCRTTNLPWFIDGEELGAQFNLKHVLLINDLEANAYGISALTEDMFVVLHRGDPEASGNAAVISAGTGLGEAGLFWDGTKHIPFASEGGHVGFAPRNELQIELLRYMMQQHSHVSYERVLSGPGLYNIYLFLRETGKYEEPQWLKDQLKSGDRSATITQLACTMQSQLCQSTLDLFVQIYGAEAANLCLKVMARGGLYIGGGIAPKIIKKLREQNFMEAFFDKGRMRPILEDIPVRVILNDKTALLGAAQCALERF